jgi:hypothetical protein
MFNLSAVMSIPAKLDLHQVNLKVGPIMGKMMAKVNGCSQWMSRAYGAATVVAVTLRLVDDLSGELLVYPSDLWLSGGLLCCGFTMLRLSSWWPLFDLWS